MDRDTAISLVTFACIVFAITIGNVFFIDSLTDRVEVLEQRLTSEGR